MNRGLRRRFGGRSNFPLALLAMQLLQFGLDRIPPVTLFSIVAQTLLFLNPHIVPYVTCACQECV